MKKSILIGLFLCALFTVTPTQKTHAIVWVVVKAAAKKIIKAIDLQVQRLQNKTIGLQNAQKVVENALSKAKLNEISGWVNKQKDLYQTYYDELVKVKSLIAYYQEIRIIIQKQVDMVNEYKEAYNLFRNDNHFTPDEIIHMGEVYDGILSQSAQNLKAINLAIKSFLSMNDASRLLMIYEASEAIDEKYNDLCKYNSTNKAKAINRARDENDLRALRQLYGDTD
ncbi:conjugal transfer protein TraI [Chitinophaga silvisoli]|uniref:Conjugal transfer protein TraI n=1 Tax=Chitinophaga silvisoli TaxID=2291814 RepID=A0A3E1P2S6_9BACT|nr:conjugal transfer protein TraI [Chitinophaga silvisoli]RFM34430.1 conjugal transfer protein TraI [Chitinophaga silvisoli]